MQRGEEKCPAISEYIDSMFAQIRAKETSEVKKRGFNNPHHSYPASSTTACKSSSPAQQHNHHLSFNQQQSSCYYRQHHNAPPLEAGGKNEPLSYNAEFMGQFTGEEEEEEVGIPEPVPRGRWKDAPSTMMEVAAHSTSSQAKQDLGKRGVPSDKGVLANRVGRLPLDMLGIVFSFLDWRPLCAVEGTCKRWAIVARSDRIWSELLYSMKIRKTVLQQHLAMEDIPRAGCKNYFKNLVVDRRTYVVEQERREEETFRQTNERISQKVTQRANALRSAALEEEQRINNSGEHRETVSGAAATVPAAPSLRILAKEAEGRLDEIILKMDSTQKLLIQLDRLVRNNRTQLQMVERQQKNQQASCPGVWSEVELEGASKNRTSTSSSTAQTPFTSDPHSNTTTTNNNNFLEFAMEAAAQRDELDRFESIITSSILSDATEVPLVLRKGVRTFHELELLCLHLRHTSSPVAKRWGKFKSLFPVEKEWMGLKDSLPLKRIPPGRHQQQSTPSSLLSPGSLGGKRGNNNGGKGENALALARKMMGMGSVELRQFME